MRRFLFALWVLITGCGRNVPVVTPPVVVIPPPVDCAWVTGSRFDGPPADCDLIVKEFKRAQAMLVELGPRFAAAADTKIEELNLYRPERLHTPGRRVPVIQLGTSQVQGYVGPANFIAYAHEGVIFCEALHYLFWKIEPAGDEWQNIGHDTANDVLHFPCWQVIEREWNEQHPP